MFTKQELASLLALLNRVSLQGNEAVTVALLIQKIDQYIKSEDIKIEPEKADGE